MNLLAPLSATVNHNSAATLKHFLFLLSVFLFQSASCCKLLITNKMNSTFIERYTGLLPTFCVLIPALFPKLISHFRSSYSSQAQTPTLSNMCACKQPAILHFSSIKFPYPQTIPGCFTPLLYPRCPPILFFKAFSDIYSLLIK